MTETPAKTSGDRREIRLVFMVLLLITVAALAWHEFHKPVPGAPTQPQSRTELVDGKTITVITDLPYNFAPAIRPEQLTLDMFIPSHAEKAPILVYIHGGGWMAGNKNGIGPKGLFFASRGIIVASVNYRLATMMASPNAADDVTAAIAYLRKTAPTIGGDANRIVLMGHSAGAHVAALIACDRQYLARYGLKNDALAGSILLDGSAYNIPSLMMTSRGKEFVKIFGKNPGLWEEVSPVHQVSKHGKTMPMILAYAGDDPIRRAAAEDLAQAAKATGGSVRVISLPGYNHLMIDQNLTTDTDEFSRSLLQFVRGE